MPYRISRLGIVEIRSLDLDRDLDYYLNVLGLQLTAQEGKTAYLKGWDERHAYSVALTEAAQPGMVRLAFRTVDPEDLDYYEQRLRRFSVKYDTWWSSTTRWTIPGTCCRQSIQRRGRRG
jgi:catechol 2,3-dioxygenase-like lactoylglutathione lyase family enzyme